MRKLIWIGLLIFSPLLMSAQQTPTPDQSVITLQVWWTDALYPLQNENAARLLEAQFEDFNRTHSQVRVEVRLKRAEGSGSIYTTLQAGQHVAPNAMPDLILIRRSDLERAATNGLVKILDGWIPDTMRQELLPNTLSLGEFDGVLYGLPYALVLQHTVYNSTLIEDVPLSFDDVLNTHAKFLLPGLPRVDQQVNDVLLAQYLQAGGSLTNIEESPALSAEELLALLSYYQDGLHLEVFNPEIGGYDVPGDYWNRFVQQEASIMVVNSTLYLQGDLEDAGVAPLPSINGEPLIVMDGWLWGVVTADPERQNAALGFIEWLMRPDQMAEYTEAFGVLPSLRPALRIWKNEAYANQVTTWIPNAIILPKERRNNAATQLQAAFIAVINGTPAEEAANAAFNELTE